MTRPERTNDRVSIAESGPSAPTWARVRASTSLTSERENREKLESLPTACFKNNFGTLRWVPAADKTESEAAEISTAEGVLRAKPVA